MRFTLILNTVLILLLTACTSSTQDRTASEQVPETDKQFLLTYPNLENPGGEVLLENEHVRIILMTLKAGESDQQHSHRDESVYFIKGGKLRVHMPAGESVELEMPDGGVMWHEEWTHRVENIGDTDLQAVVVETQPQG